jgi:hypothetical protein
MKRNKLRLFMDKYKEKLRSRQKNFDFSATFVEICRAPGLKNAADRRKEREGARMIDTDFLGS